jgi:ornithine cyclodeaminase/alanine dehydrogenase-like protein (mu-crystallin family)
MLVITAAEVEALLPMPAAIEVMRRAMIQVSERRTVLPLRQFMAIPDAPGKLAVMPGYIADPPVFGVKTVAKYTHPPGSPLGSHVGMVQLFDAETGLLLAVIEGGTLTAIRTAAASALATDTLARPGACRLAIIGTGEQARRHVTAMAAVRPIAHVSVWGRNPAHALSFAASLDLPARVAATVESAVADADIICTTTPATEPILFGAALRPGSHVNLVGSAIPTTAEADVALVARSEFYVDYREAALAQAGELRNAIAAGAVTADHVRGEIGEVLLGLAPGRSDAAAITVYKSLGVTAQDLAAGAHVLDAARAQGLGRAISLH